MVIVYTMSCRHWHKRASRCFERRTIRCVTSEWQNAAVCKAASFESNVYFSGRAYVVASVNKPFALCIFYFMQRWKDWQTQMTVFCRATKISRRTRLIGVTKLPVIRLMFHGIFTDRVSGQGTTIGRVRPSVCSIDRKQVANVGSVMLTADEEAERKLLHVCYSYVYLAGD